MLEIIRLSSSSTATRKNYLLMCLMVVLVGLSAGQCVPTSVSPRIERFATVKAVAGQGEAGSELQLEERGMRVAATLRDYLGAGELIETHLTGTLSETKVGVCRIYLSGKNKTGEVEIDGQIEITRFRGTATRTIGKDVFSHAISLRRQLPSGAPHIG